MVAEVGGRKSRMPRKIQPANRPKSPRSPVRARGSTQEMPSFNSWLLRLHNALITKVFPLPAIFSP